MFKLLNKRQKYDLMDYIKLNKSQVLNKIPGLMKVLCEVKPEFIKYAQGPAASLELFEQVINHPDSTIEMLYDAVHYSRGICNNYEIMKRLCAMDGRLIKYCPGEILTFELFQIALKGNGNGASVFEVEDCLKNINLNNTDIKELEKLIAYDGKILSKLDEKKITKKLVQIAFSNQDQNRIPAVMNLYNMKESKRLMRYLCEIDGINFIYGYEDALTADLLKFALNHPDENKRLTYEKIPENIDFTLKYSEVKDLIKEDARWLKFVDINSLNEFELISILKRGDIAPDREVIEHFKRNRNVLKTLTEEVKKGKYTIKELKEMLSIEIDQKFINTSFFEEVSKRICKEEDLDYNLYRNLIEKAISTNKEILLTLNFKLLHERFHKLYEEKDKLFTLSIYPRIQTEIIKIGNPRKEDGTIDIELGDKRVELLSRMLKSALKFKNGDKISEWPLYYNKIIKEFSNQLDIYDWAIKDLDKLDDELITKLTNHILGNHGFEIKSLEDLKNYEKIREAWIDKKTSSHYLEDVKDAVFEKVFGISIDAAKELVPYQTGILSSPELFPQDIVEFFKAINIILKEEDKELLKQTISSFKRSDKLDEKDIVHLRSIIKREYINNYNKSLYETTSIEPSSILRGVKIYKAAGELGNKKFNLCIHSLGAYFGGSGLNKININYQKDWNRPEISNHGICSSYIGNSNLGTAYIRHAVLGFTNFEEGALLLSGPEDIYSSNESFDTMGDEDRKSTYLMPQDMLDYTRHTHNEMVFERKVGSQKRQPSYIVLMCDDYEKTLLRFKLQEKIGRYTLIGKIAMMQDEKEGDQVYHALKAAKDFNIPIVVVEREKIAKNEYQEINSKLDEFMSKKTMTREEVKKYYHDIFILYANNHAGSRRYHHDIERKYFNENHALAMTQRVEEKINGLLKTNPQQALILIEELENVMKLENEKIPMNSYYVRPVYKANTIIEYCKRQKQMLLNYKNDDINIKCIFDGTINNTNFLMEYNSSKISSLDIEQYDIDSLIKIMPKDQYENLMIKINQIDMDGLYTERKNGPHSKRHIENVLFFSSVIGMDILDKKDMELLLTSALYHDSGRTSDGRVPHAVASSKIALNNLKDYYSKEDLQIIRAAIEYHEVLEENKDDGTIDFTQLENICKNLGMDINDEKLMLRTKKIATCLKDADALDRTRFLANTRSFTNPDMLHHKVSKKLIKIGMQINEYYATIDIEKESDLNPEIIPKVLEHLKEKKNPKLTIRAIRHKEFNNSTSKEEKTNGTKK